MFDVDVRDDRNELDRQPVWRRLQSPKIAALDLGANSFHLIVAEPTGHERFQVVERLKERVQLGESTFETGRIDAATFERGLAALRRLREVAQRHGPETVLAVATSAVRDAENGRHFLQHAIRSTGFAIALIDGLEEARLVCLGARQSVALEGRRMALVDLGGGSTEVVLADQSTCLLTASLDLGALRLRSMWASQDPPTRADIVRLERRVALIVEPTIAHLHRLGFDIAVLSCGTARALVRLARAEAASTTAPLAPQAGLATLQTETLRRLEGRLSTLSEARRRELVGAEPGRVDMLLTGAVALRVLLEKLRVDEALVANTGLREGLIADHLSKRTLGASTRIAG